MSTVLGWIQDGGEVPGVRSPLPLDTQILGDPQLQQEGKKRGACMSFTGLPARSRQNIGAQYRASAVKLWADIGQT